MGKLIGWGMVATGAYLSIKDWATIPDKAQGIANDIYIESGMKEHYDEIDDAYKELEEINQR